MGDSAAERGSVAACAPRWPSRSASPAPRRASRAWPARAAARRCPESCSGSWIRARSTGSRRGCRRARRSSRRPTARRRPPRWSRGSSSRRCGWRTTAPGANLVSGVASALVAARDAELGLFEVDEAALPEVARRVSPRAVSLGNLFRDQLDRYGELELVAERWREMARGLPRRRRSWRTATTRSSARSPRNGLARWSSASTTRATPRPSCSTRPTRSGASAAGRRTTTPPPTSAISATTAARRAATRGRRSTSSAREIELNGLESVSFSLDTPEGSTRVELQVPGLYNVYNALAAASLARALGASLDVDRRRLAGLCRRVRPLRADPARRALAAPAADQEPGRRERGRAHARRRRRAPRCCSSR